MAKSKTSSSASSISIKNKNNRVGTKVARITAVAHQGPLPMASEFAAYEQVLPGSANRILRMAEKSLESEISLMRAARAADLIALLSGRLFLYVLVSVSVYLLVSDRPIGALLAGLAPIVSAIYGTFKKPDRQKGR